MAPRSVWKGYLKLSLVNCAVALYPAVTEARAVHFHRINRKTGNRLRIHLFDEETNQEVEKDDQAKGYEIAKGEMVEVTEEELDNVRLEATHIMEINRFVDRNEVDPLFFDRPYYLSPDDKPSQEAFQVIREAMARRKLAALSTVVMHQREHIVLLEPRDAGLMATVLRWPYEVRGDEEVFADLTAAPKLDKDLLEVADALVERKLGAFDPAEFHDRYEESLRTLLEAKKAGKKAPKAPKAPAATKPTGILEALRLSLQQEGAPTERRRPAASAAKAPAAKARKTAAARRTATKR
ncbi:non-homologous end joining protein Ku [Alsobacter metallidurans]|uniref:Non-homologous end joining protein Ku n=1 Tax=Alsobacter metallidurans TaxID=340221 RepID=A0A917MH02_9HYPH|nr:Ku protein [Alsobacter metallidurans]GGH18254.1 non-homologous end joining protein Ku [Alsobacter metallidurans]